MDPSPGADGFDVWGLGFVRVETFGGVGELVLLVEHGFFADVDLAAGLLVLGELDEVADFSFEADVGDDAVASLGIDAREVAGIGIAVGIAVGGVEEEDEVVAVIHGRIELS